MSPEIFEPVILQKITVEDLQEKLRLHQEWLDSGAIDKDDPRRANLVSLDLTEFDLWYELSQSNCEKIRLNYSDLSGAELPNVNFRDAVIWFAKLENVNLESANFTDASCWCSSFKFSNLNYVKFNNAFLINTHFVECDLIDTDFEKAKLQNSDFRFSCALRAWFKGADLDSATLSNCDLTGAQFLGASLENVNLLNSIGIEPRHLSSTNLENTLLPERLEKYKYFEMLNQSTKSCKNIFHFLLIVCFTFFIIRFSQSPTFTIPTLAINVQLVDLFFWGGLGLLAAFIYFQMYLQSHWEILSDMPSIFSDGSRLDKNVSSWLISTYVCVHSRYLFPHDLSWTKDVKLGYRLFYWARFFRYELILKLFFIHFLGWFLVPSTLWMLYKSDWSMHRWELIEIHFWTALLATCYAFYMLIQASLILVKSNYGVFSGARQIVIWSIRKIFHLPNRDVFNLVETA